MKYHRACGTNSPAAQALMKEHQYQDSKDLQGHLFRYAENKLKQLGKRTGGWEAAQHGDKACKETIIYSWLSGRSSHQLRSPRLLMWCCNQHSLPISTWPRLCTGRPGVDWAAVIPLEQAYTYEALLRRYPTPTQFVSGSAAFSVLYGEIVTNQKRMDYMVFPRISALAEGRWQIKQPKLARLPISPKGATCHYSTDSMLIIATLGKLNKNVTKATLISSGCWLQIKVLSQIRLSITI